MAYPDHPYSDIALRRSSKTLEIEVIRTIDSIGFGFGECFGRNITVNQFDYFSSNSTRCMYVAPCSIIRNQESEILAYEIE